MSERVLVLSLLRAGDALVHLPALASLAAPDRELHLLVQAAGKPAAELLAPFATVHVLPINYLGGDVAPIASLLAHLTELAFDRVVNLTLKPFAGELAERIAPGRVEGFILKDGRPKLTSPWLRLLNDWGTAAAVSVVHYADIYSHAVGNPRRDPQLVLSAEDQRWWSETRANIPAGTPLVLVQLSTSEGKKTYPRALYAELIALLGETLRDAQFLLLAAPFEQAEVESFCATVGSRARPLVCTLAQAACAMRDARLLISGDTALVHLAALCRTRVLLLSSGSSAFRELGPVGEGHVVLQANFPCGPCRHDTSCIVRSDGQFPCTEAIPPGYAAEVAAAMIAGSPLPAPTISIVRTYLSRFDERGLVDYTPLGERSAADVCAAVVRADLLDRTAGVSATPLDLRPLSPDGREALISMAAVIDAFALKGRTGDSSRVTAALIGASDFVVLEMAQHLAARLRELPRNPADTSLTEEIARRTKGLLKELDSLRARINTQLA